VSTSIPPDPDQAWKALTLVNDWVKHAETKLGLSLTAAGVSSGVLFNLVKGHSHPSCFFAIAATICALTLFVGGGCAMIGLFPIVRLRGRTEDDAANPLFFHDIARAYEGDSPSYSAVLHTLTTNKNDLVEHLGQQIHANATVAQRKYRWANRAIRVLLFGLIALGTVAATIALKV
jgi:hypothetical protein